MSNRYALYGIFFFSVHSSSMLNIQIVSLFWLWYCHLSLYFSFSPIILMPIIVCLFGLVWFLRVYILITWTSLYKVHDKFFHLVGWGCLNPVPDAVQCGYCCQPHLYIAQLKYSCSINCHIPFRLTVSKCTFAFYMWPNDPVISTAH